MFPEHRYLDSAHKLAVAAEGLRGQRFCWLMDDIFLLRPVTEEWLEAPRCLPGGQNLKPVGLHKTVLMATQAMLKKHGRPTWNYSTHLPAVYDADKLLALVDAAGWTKQAYSTDMLYFNWYHDDPLTIRPEDQLRLAQAQSVPRLTTALANARPATVNLHAGMWKAAGEAIRAEFPDPTPMEGSAGNMRSIITSFHADAPDKEFYAKAAGRLAAACRYLGLEFEIGRAHV